MPSGATYEDHEGPVIIYRRGGGAKGAVDIDHMVFRKLGKRGGAKEAKDIGGDHVVFRKMRGREGAKGWGLHGLKKIGGEGGRGGC